MKFINLQTFIAAIVILIASIGCSSNSGSTGPASDSQKQAAEDFVRKMVSSQMPPEMAQQAEVSFESELPSDLTGFNLFRLRIKIGANIQTFSVSAHLHFLPSPRHQPTRPSPNRPGKYRLLRYAVLLHRHSRQGSRC